MATWKYLNMLYAQCDGCIKSCFKFMGLWWCSVSLVATSHSHTKKNCLVNQVKFLGLMHVFATSVTFRPFCTLHGILVNILLFDCTSFMHFHPWNHRLGILSQQVHQLVHCNSIDKLSKFATAIELFYDIKHCLFRQACIWVLLHNLNAAPQIVYDLLAIPCSSHPWSEICPAFL